MKREYACLEVTGLEVEYPIVGNDLQILRLAPRLLEEVAECAGASDAELCGAGLSNEFVDHVIEFKNIRPYRTLGEIEAELARSVAEFSRHLREYHGARLLPLGMHPLMRPDEAGLWALEGSEIYQTYARVFDVVQHGWTNVQSCHVNLPFGSDAECVLMMNAAALLLPYLPALASTSPFQEGKVAEAVDQRLKDLVTLQSRVPESGGDVIPEYLDCLGDYDTKVLGPMFRALDRLPGTEILRHDFFNSRGAVLKFSRRALEIRVLDVQECVRMDTAMAAFCRAAIRSLSSSLASNDLALPEHQILVADYRASLRMGRDAPTLAPHLGSAENAGTALERLFVHAEAAATEEEARYLQILAPRLSRGSLSEQLRRRVRRSPGDSVPASVLHEIASELSSCLELNRPYGT